MARTVGQMARVAGVSIRTLRHYDEIGLLKPAYVGANGYRYYDREQLLRLQQILFYRELGLPLEEIGGILAAPDFDTVAALKAHRAKLEAEARRYRRLIRTIDRTIASLSGEWTMDEQELYYGFAPEKQREYEQEIATRFGPGALKESKRRLKGWRREDFERSKGEMEALHAAFADALNRGAEPDSDEVQALTARHHAWVNRFWTPSAEAYAGLGQLYVDHPDFRALYEGVRPGLTEYLARAMRLYAARSL